MLQLQWNNAVEDIIDIEVINSLRKYKNIVIFGAGIGRIGCSFIKAF